jgi:hypothetical protein
LTGVARARFACLGFVSLLGASAAAAQNACVATTQRVDSMAIERMGGFYQLYTRERFPEGQVRVDSALIELRRASSFYSRYTRSLSDSSRWILGSYRPIWGFFHARFRGPDPVQAVDSTTPEITVMPSGLLIIRTPLDPSGSLRFQIEKASDRAFRGTWTNAGIPSACTDDCPMELPRRGTFCAVKTTRD